MHLNEFMGKSELEIRGLGNGKWKREWKKVISANTAAVRQFLAFSSWNGILKSEKSEGQDGTHASKGLHRVDEVTPQKSAWSNVDP